MSEINADDAIAERLNEIEKEFRKNVFNLQYAYDKGIIIQESWIEMLRKMVDEMREIANNYEYEKFQKIVDFDKQVSQIVSEVNADGAVAEQLNEMGKQFHDKVLHLGWAYDRGVTIKDSWMEELEKLLDEMREIAGK